MNTPTYDNPQAPRFLSTPKRSQAGQLPWHRMARAWGTWL